MNWASTENFTYLTALRDKRLRLPSDFLPSLSLSRSISRSIKEGESAVSVAKDDDRPNLVLLELGDPLRL